MIGLENATEKIAAEEFIRQLGFTTGVGNVLAACYYAEFVEASVDFSALEIQKVLEAARVPFPSNLARDLKSLAASSKRYLNIAKSTGGGAMRYSLTTLGADIIAERMQAVGLTISKATERIETLKEISESLHALIAQIPDQAEREYIEEAISCLSPMNNASRAGVIMGWTGTVYNLRRKVDRLGPAGYALFTTHLQRINPRKSAHNFNDLEDVKDADLLDICEKLDIVKGKAVKDQLIQWLTFRNGVGHPTNVRPGINKVKAFFEDIIQYVIGEP